jgi:hypothetical protein
MFSTVRDRKCLLEIFKGLTHVEDLCQCILDRDGDNIGNVLSPDDVSLMKTVKLEKEGISLLLMWITVLLTQST